MADDVKIVISAEDKASSVFNKVWDSASKMWTTVWKAGDEVVSSSKSMTKSLMDNKEWLVAIGAGSAIAFAGLSSVIKWSIDAGIKMEQTRVTFSTMMWGGNEWLEKANKLLLDLWKTAKQTPFTLDWIQDTTKQLMAYGIEAKDIIPTIKMIWDASWWNQQKFEMMAYAFWQIRTNGKLMGQDLMQLTNQGFNPLESMAVRTWKSISELRDDMSKGKISFDMVKQSFIDVTSEWGKFYNMMDKQSQTVGGKLSNLEDSRGQLKVAIWTALLPVMQKLVDLVWPLLARLQEWVQANPELATNILLVATALTGLLAGAVALGFILPALSAGLVAIWEWFALLMWPVWLIIAGIVALYVARQTNFLWIRDIVNSVWMFLQTLPAIRNNIVTGISAWLTAMWSFFSATWQAIKDGVSLFWEGMKMLFQAELDLIIWLIWWFVGVFVGVMTAFYQLLTGDRQQARNTLSETFVNVWNGIVAFISPVIETIKTILSSAWDAITSTFARVWNNIKIIFVGTWELIKSIAINAVTAMKEFFGGSWKALLENAFTSMVSWFAGIAKSVLNAVITVFENMINVAIDGINALIKAANAVSPVKIWFVGRASLPRLAKWWFVHGETMGERLWGIAHFASGGMVDWPKGIDKVPAMLSDGELVLNQAQQGSLASFIRGGSQSGWPTVQITIWGNNFYWDDKSFAEKIGDTIVAQFRQHYAFEHF